jgi:hypothetical protein
MPFSAPAFELVRVVLFARVASAATLGARLVAAGFATSPAFVAVGSAA